MKIYSFEKLEVWQDARKMTILVYQLTKKFPKEETYGLTSQIRRASISVCSNIAEGSARTTNPDQAYFYRVAYSSLIEVLNHSIISCDLVYLGEGDLDIIRKEVEKISNKLNKLRSRI